MPGGSTNNQIDEPINCIKTIAAQIATLKKI